MNKIDEERKLDLDLDLETLTVVDEGEANDLTQGSIYSTWDDNTYGRNS